MTQVPVNVDDIAYALGSKELELIGLRQQVRALTQRLTELTPPDPTKEVTK